MKEIIRTAKANEELLKQRFQNDRFIDDMLETLHRAKGLAGFIGDAACLSQGPDPYHEIDLKNLERTVNTLELEIKDAIVILNDYWQQQSYARRAHDEQ